MHTEAKALSQDASRRHVFLSFYLCEGEGAGKDENIHEVDEAVEEGDWSLHRQTVGGFDILQFMLVVDGGKITELFIDKSYIHPSIQFILSTGSLKLLTIQ